MSSVERLCSRHVLKYNLEILFLYTSPRTHRGELIPASPSRYPKRNGFGSAEPNGSPLIPFWADWACWWPRLCLFKGRFFPWQIPGETVLLHASFQHIVLCFLRGCRSANLLPPPPPLPVSICSCTQEGCNQRGERQSAKAKQTEPEQSVVFKRRT